MSHTPPPAAPRRRRRWWLIPVGIVCAVALVATGVAVTNLLEPRTATTPAASGVSTPAAVNSASPVAGVDYASGCVGGVGITAEDVLHLQAEKQFTPAGAAEFVGAFMQVYAAADPARRPHLRDLVDAATTGDAHRVYASFDLSQPGYDDGQVHGIDLAKSAYLIRDANGSTVTLAFAGLTTTNGKPDPVPNTLHDYQYSGGTFTLTTSTHGWMITSYDPSPGFDEALTTGHSYRDGC